MIRYLLSKKELKNIEYQFLDCPDLILFLDYDGTLAPFKENPADAIPYPGITKLLNKLISHTDTKISIITGRTLKDIKKLINIKKIYYAGIHGMEIEDFSSPVKKIPDNLRKKIISILSKQDLKIEDKKYALTIHYKNSYSEKNIFKIINKIINQDIYEIMKGRKIIELRPKNYHKGKAVAYLMNKLNSNIKSMQPIVMYIGDDTTDEDAFKYLKNKKKSISIYVKNEANLDSIADYYLNNPYEVKSFLNKLFTYIKPCIY